MVEVPPCLANSRGVTLERNAVKRCHAITRLEWAFVGVSMVSLVASIGFTIDRLAMLPKTSDDFTFALVLLFTTMMCIYYVLHGILKERPYEIIVFAASVIVVLIYCIISLYGDPKMGLKQIRLGFATVLAVATIGIGIPLLKRYFQKWKFIYRFSASGGMRSMLRAYFFCHSLIVFDLQFQGSMLIFVLDTGLVTTLTEKLILGFGALVTIAWFLCGFYGMRQEHKVLSGAFLVLSFPAPAYIVYRIVLLQTTNPVGSLFYNGVMACAVFALAARLLVLIVMAFVIRNFGKNVKETLDKKCTERTVLAPTDCGIPGTEPVQEGIGPLSIQEC